MSGFAFDAPTVIRTKRDGGRLSDAAIDWVINAYADGHVADEQMSALLMAIFWRGMDRGEIARWTAAMLASGERLDFRDLGVPTVDKHSTGGVGQPPAVALGPDHRGRVECDVGQGRSRGRSAVKASGSNSPRRRGPAGWSTSSSGPPCSRST